MNIKELQDQAIEVANLYRKKNKEDGHNHWTVEQYMSGMIGDIGDLQKLIMAKQGYRHKEDIDQALEHELGDVLWSLLVISKELNINLETAFLKTMKELKGRF